MLSIIINDLDKIRLSCFVQEQERILFLLYVYTHKYNTHHIQYHTMYIRTHIQHNMIHISTTQQCSPHLTLACYHYFAQQLNC